LYKEYESGSKKASRNDGEFSREEKLNLMRDVFSVEYNDQFINNMFPEFYS
jgi:hypothetical protein